MDFGLHLGKYFDLAALGRDHGFLHFHRAIESNYLNQLSRMGWLNKRRISRTIHFRPASEKMPKKAILAGMKGPKAKWAPH